MCEWWIESLSVAWRNVPDFCVSSPFQMNMMHAFVGLKTVKFSSIRFQMNMMHAFVGLKTVKFSSIRHIPMNMIHAFDGRMHLKDKEN